MTITFDSPDQLADALRQASNAHHEYEQRTGTPDANWADWYARFMFGETSQCCDVGEYLASVRVLSEVDKRHE
jgi:hypothetical protein